MPRKKRWNKEYKYMKKKPAKSESLKKKTIQRRNEQMILKKPPGMTQTLFRELAPFLAQDLKNRSRKKK